MQNVLIPLFFLFGLIIGSFLNAVIYRMRAKETLMDRSKCPKCGALIHWYDNVPVVSFLWLRGKCRACQERISWQYPLVETGTAVAFAVVGWSVFVLDQWSSWVDTVYWLVLFSVLMVVFVYDFIYLEIPMSMIWVGIVSTALWLGFLDWRLLGTAWVWQYSVALWGMISGLGVFVVFTALSKGSKEQWMGWGDAWLMLVLGMAAGWPGVLWTVTVGSGIGSVVGVGLIAISRKRFDSQLPFAPFLILGFFVVMVLQWQGIW